MYISVCSGGGGGYRQSLKPSSRSLLGFVTLLSVT